MVAACDADVDRSFLRVNYFAFRSTDEKTNNLHTLLACQRKLVPYTISQNVMLSDARNRNLRHMYVYRDLVISAMQ